MTHSEIVTIRDGGQFRPVQVDLELDLEELAQKALRAMNQRLEALDGALKCRVKPVVQWERSPAP